MWRTLTGTATSTFSDWWLMMILSITHRTERPMSIWLGAVVVVHITAQNRFDNLSSYLTDHILSPKMFTAQMLFGGGVSSCVNIYVLCFVVSEFFACLWNLIAPQEQSLTSDSVLTTCSSSIFYSGLNSTYHLCADFCRSHNERLVTFCSQMCPGNILFSYLFAVQIISSYFLSNFL